MAQRYVLKNFAPGTKKNGKDRSGNLLFRLSSIGITSDTNVIKSSLSMGMTQTQTDSVYSQINDFSPDFYDTAFAQYRDITKSNGEYIAFFNNSYELRRTYLRQFAQNGEINFVLETIADEAIVQDENNYFCQIDLDKLKSNVNSNYPKSDELIKNCEKAFKRVYSTFGWDQSNDAWDYFKKFLVDGFLAFEVIFSYTTDKEGNKVAQDIIAFKELDPITLEPDIVKDDVTGEISKIWYQFKGDSTRQRIIPDANLIYISWARGNFSEASRVSYLEGLTRSFNMLRQLENSRVMWNVQNAQKRIKIVVPVGTMSPERAKNRMSQLKAMYNEETVIDDLSGEITVNGSPKFSFSKTYMFPSAGGTQTEISEMGVEGYDLNSTDQLKYFWRRFILETKIPANRFVMDIGASQGNPLTEDSTVTREEYAFSRFISRIQTIFKEILLKPIWIQVCLKMPELAKSEYFRTYLGIKYNDENLFTLAKERKAAGDGANIISQLSGLQYKDQSPVFSMKFLIKKYLDISEEDWKLNQKYIEGDKLADKEAVQQQQNNQPANDGGFGDAGGGFGGDAGGGFGGGGDFGNEPAPSDGGLGGDTGGEAPAPDAGGLGDTGDAGGL